MASATFIASLDNLVGRVGEPVALIAPLGADPVDPWEPAAGPPAEETFQMHVFDELDEQSGASRYHVILTATTLSSGAVLTTISQQHRVRIRGEVLPMTEFRDKRVGGVVIWYSFRTEQ